MECLIFVVDGRWGIKASSLVAINGYDPLRRNRRELGTP